MFHEGTRKWTGVRSITIGQHSAKCGTKWKPHHSMVWSPQSQQICSSSNPQAITILLFFYYYSFFRISLEKLEHKSSPFQCLVLKSFEHHHECNSDEAIPPCVMLPKRRATISTQHPFAWSLGCVSSHQIISARLRFLDQQGSSELQSGSKLRKITVQFRIIWSWTWSWLGCFRVGFCSFYVSTRIMWRIAIILRRVEVINWSRLVWCSWRSLLGGSRLGFCVSRSMSFGNPNWTSLCCS